MIFGYIVCDTCFKKEHLSNTLGWLILKPEIGDRLEQITPQKDFCCYNCLKDYATEQAKKGENTTKKT
jgi:hypothetical protein